MHATIRRGTPRPRPERAHLRAARHTAQRPATMMSALIDDELLMDLRLFDAADDLLGDPPEPGPEPSGTPEPASEPEPAPEPDGAQAEPPDDGGASAEPDGDGESEPATRYLGRYNTLDEAENAHKSLQTEYQATKALIDKLGGKEAVQRFLEQQQAPAQAHPQAQPVGAQQPAQPEGDGLIDTPWGRMTPEDADAKGWEMGLAASQRAWAVFEAEKATAGYRQQQNTQMVAQQMAAKHKDFQTFLPAMVEMAQADPELAAEFEQLAASDPRRYAREVENLYYRVKAEAAPAAVAEATKAGENAAKLKAEQQRAASAGTQAGRGASQAPPPEEDPLVEFFGEPRIP